MIILINPPNPPGKISNKDMMGGLGQLYNPGASRIPPIDIPYAAACLRQNGHHVSVIDCLGLRFDTEMLVHAVSKTVNENKYSYLAIRSSLPTFQFDVSVAEALKRSFQISVIFFGPHVTLQPEKILCNPSIDAVVLGEPERTLVSVCAEGLENAEGVCLRKENGQIICRDAPDGLLDLEDMPYPAWDLMPYDQYFLSGQQFPEEAPFLPVQSSRGCPFGCHYCPYPVFQGRHWRSRSAQNVFGELIYIVQELGIHNVLFRDPEFTLDRERILALCREIGKISLSFNWRCETRVDTLDEILIAEMRQAGCVGINLGIETSSPETSKNIGRKVIPTAQIRETVRQCRNAGIRVFCFFILGLPGQDKKEIFQLIDLANELDPDDVQFTYATPYPATLLQQWAERNGFIEDVAVERYTGYDPVMRNEFLSTRQLRRLMRYAAHAVHMRRRLRLKRIDQRGHFQYCIEMAKQTFLISEKLILHLL
jgi:anaerobic magnesium-protoporphyrin IX monomethyl ester cyclase